MAVHEPLLALLEESLARGHWRVACRRYLMLEACRTAVPRRLRRRCERLLLQCSERELRRMRVDAAHWAHMCAPARSIDVAWFGALSSMPGVARPAPTAAIRTQWRPLPAFLPA